MSPGDPESDAGLPPWGWHCLVPQGFSHGLVLEPSPKEPDVRTRMDSGESASSLARERLLRAEGRVFKLHGHPSRSNGRRFK